MTQTLWDGHRLELRSVVAQPGTEGPEVRTPGSVVLCHVGECGIPLWVRTASSGVGRVQGRAQPCGAQQILAPSLEGVFQVDHKGILGL